MLFSLVSQVLLLLCRITSSFSTCKSCHCTAEGLTFSDPMHKKSARNSNLYYFCHSRKKLTALSPFSCLMLTQHFFVSKELFWTTLFGYSRVKRQYQISVNQVVCILGNSHFLLAIAQRWHLLSRVLPQLLLRQQREDMRRDHNEDITCHSPLPHSGQLETYNRRKIVQTYSVGGRWWNFLP
jgi:hypothetical protein